MSSLPIDSILSNLPEYIRDHPNLVLSAAPGAGKTTRVPLALLQIIPQGRIVMLEPRRIAAASAARYMASLLGEQVGQTVGYTIRFDRKVAETTRIEVVTEGVLTRRIQNDPELPGVSCVIFDEFHERSLHADLGLTLCLETQASLRPDLKLLVMSATLDCAPVARLLGDAPVLVSAGRQYPVDQRYLQLAERQPLVKQMAAVIRAALAEEAGDLLAFLPGSGEIRGVERELTGLTAAVVCPLYGDLPFEQQQRAILPGPQRRVVLATSIAETSLTIEGVRLVVDSGLSRRLQLDPATGLERLVTVRASQAQADQRAGRAGRTAPGVCYRLYSRQTWQAMTPFSPPEIMTADLAPLLLELAAWGVNNPASLTWLDAPPAHHLTTARELLLLLDAVDGCGWITPLGRQMVRLPLHPRLGRLVLASQEQGEVAAGCLLAAQLTSRAAHARSVQQVAGQLLRLLGEQQVPLPYDPLELLSALPESLVAAWPDRIAMLRDGTDDRYLLASGRGARLSPKAGCPGSRFLVALQVDGGQGSDGVIHQAVGIAAEQLRIGACKLITKGRQVWWDAVQGRVTAAEEERIGAVLLTSRQVAVTDAEGLPLLLAQIRRSGLGLLHWTDQARQLQARVGLAAALLPEEKWPDLSDGALLDALETWLAPHLVSCCSLRMLQQVPLIQLLHELIGYKLMQSLNIVAPERLLLPSGRKAALEYNDPDGPVLSAKLQELFGLAASPMVCRGRRPVLVHLLSPAGRPVAITRDLTSFWERGYPEVRKELRGRYPKHPWPDDPWNAVATHRTKKALEKG